VIRSPGCGRNEGAGRSGLQAKRCPRKTRLFHVVHAFNWEDAKKLYQIKQKGHLRAMYFWVAIANAAQGRV
jgi:hypothetical protein